MTRKEAIKGLKVLAKDFSGYRPNEEMFNMAIEALEQPEQTEAIKEQLIACAAELLRIVATISKGEKNEQAN